MLFRLVILNGPMSGQQVTVPETAMTVGRSADCDLTLDDDEAALEHLELRMHGGALHIRDLGSMSGSLVNQVETREGRIKHGDVLEVGRTRMLVEAHVQAEVPVGGRPRLSMRRGMVRFAGLSLLLVLSAWMVSRARRKAPMAHAVGGGQGGAAVAVTPEDAAGTLDMEPLASEDPEGRTESVDLSPSLPVPQETVRDGPVSEELRLLRGDLESIRDAVAHLAETHARVPQIAETEAKDPQGEAIRSMLQRVSGEREADRLPEAERLLEGILVLDPEFVPAWEERARLFEARGQLKRAETEWARVEEREDDPEGRIRARQEQERLALRQREVEADAASLIIASLGQRKFPERDGILEMRTVTVGLAPEDPHVRPDPSTVLVEVAFFERELSEGGVFPSRRVGPVQVRPEGDWNFGEVKNVVATYRIDASPSTRATRVPVEDGVSYVGYRVRLYVRGELRAEVFRPVTLADIPSASAAASMLPGP